MTLKIDDVFDKGVSAAHKEIMRKHCAYLAKATLQNYGTLSSNSLIFFEELDEKYNDSDFYQSVLGDTFTLIKKQKQISIFPCLVFLCAIYKVDKSDRNLALLLQYRVIDAACTLTILGGYEGFIKRVLICR
jgi:hypothetical protein